MSETSAEAMFSVGENVTVVWNHSWGMRRETKRVRFAYQEGENNFYLVGHSVYWDGTHGISTSTKDKAQNYDSSDEGEWYNWIEPLNLSFEI